MPLDDEDLRRIRKGIRPPDAAPPSSISPLSPYLGGKSKTDARSSSGASGLFATGFGTNCFQRAMLWGITVGALLGFRKFAVLKSFNPNPAVRERKERFRSTVTHFALGFTGAGTLSWVNCNRKARKKKEEVEFLMRANELLAVYRKQKEAGGKAGTSGTTKQTPAQQKQPAAGANAANTKAKS